MRFEGRLASWDDARGFGFIEPSKGGSEVFVHAKAFGPRAARPALHQRVSFEVGLNARGRKRAFNVRAVGAEAPARRGRPVPASAARPGPGLLAIPLFAALVAAAAFTSRLPIVVPLVYLGASCVCFFAYAFDKSAAERGTWRTSEGTLLMLGLACGWPGGLLAQQMLRHKIRKPSFMAAFWATVIVNVIVFVLYAWPSLRAQLLEHVA